MANVSPDLIIFVLFYFALLFYERCQPVLTRFSLPWSIVIPFLICSVCPEKPWFEPDTSTSGKAHRTWHGSRTYEDTETTLVDSPWERQVRSWCPWSRPRRPPSTLCVSNVANSTGHERTTCTITRTRWTTTWSAIFAFSLCCSHWTPPVDTRSAASASETSYRRRISVRWTGNGCSSSRVRSLAFWFTSFWTSC